MTSIDGDHHHVRLGLDDRIAALHLTDPDRLNCVSVELAEDLRDLVRHEIRPRIDDLSVITITAEGDSFCAGADRGVITEYSDDDTIEDRQVLRSRYRPPFDYLTNAPVPVIAGGRGYAVGAGAGLFCVYSDINVAAPDMEIWWPEIEYGIPPFGTVARLSAEIGTSRALELALFSEEGKMTAQEAHNAGMINRIVDSAAVEDTVRRLAEMVAEYDEAHGYIEALMDVSHQARREAKGSILEYASWVQNEQYYGRFMG